MMAAIPDSPALRFASGAIATAVLGGAVALAVSLRPVAIVVGKVLVGVVAYCAGRSRGRAEALDAELDASRRLLLGWDEAFGSAEYPRPALRVLPEPRR